MQYKVAYLSALGLKYNIAASKLDVYLILLK